MGIQNLNQHIIGRSVTLADLRGRSFAIDGHTFLHKAGQIFARYLLLKHSITEIANQVYKWVAQFAQYASHVIVVFDGAYLPAKRPTNQRRAEARKRALEEANSMLGEQQLRVLQYSVSFSFQQVRDIADILISRFNNSQFYCFLAPFEADAQLAFLSQTNLADVIVTLDSDIYLYGVENVLFNYNFGSGEGKYVEGCKNELFDDFLNLRKCCILSGCDYVGSLKGIGIKKAYEAVLEAKSIVGAFESLNKGKPKEFPEGMSISEYVWRLIEALFVFYYMRVYDPVQDRVVMLNKLETDAAIYERVGDIIGEADSLENTHQGSPAIRGSVERLRQRLGEQYIGQISCSQIVQYEGINVATLRSGVIQCRNCAEAYRRPRAAESTPQPRNPFKSIHEAVKLE